MDLVEMFLIAFSTILLLACLFLGVAVMYDNVGCDEFEKVKVSSTCYKGNCAGVDPVTGEYFKYNYVCISRSDDD